MGDSYKIPKAPQIDFDQLQREARKKASEGGSTSERAREMERTELDSLIDRGTTYTIRYTKRTGLFKRRLKPMAQTYTIHEPTLAILDEISAIALDLELEDTELAAGGMNTIAAARRAVRKNAWRLARIVAIATLGETAYNVYSVGSHVRRTKNTKRIQALTSLIYNCATPSQLNSLANAVTSMSNLGSFINSTRLMSARTTAPRTELVESQGSRARTEGGVPSAPTSNGHTTT